MDLRAGERRPFPPRAASLLGLVALAGLVWLGFGSTLTSPFLTYDDPEYVTENAVVREGLSWSGVLWALTTGHAFNWHPLTWLSHMLDVSLYGLDVRGHHATSLLLHTASASLVFLLLKTATRATAASLFVAALFAVHPTRLESVVWISERKDVLSAFLGLLALSAWLGWVRRGKGPLYTLAVTLFAASLMAKPMLVTLPILLLLGDFWPLARLRGRGDVWPRVKEKWPFFALSAASGVITLLVQGVGGAVRDLREFPFEERLANAVLAVGAYVIDFAWPVRRSIFYPHPGSEVSWVAAGMVGVLLALATVAAFRLRSRLPHVLVGWAWFLVALLPVIGIIQVGMQARADRYTYLPYLGLFVAVAFTFQAAGSRLEGARVPLALVALALLTAAVLTTRAEAAHWRNERILFEHARAVTGPNAVAEHILGSVALEAGQLELAERHLRSALETWPAYGRARIDLARLLLRRGRLDEAAALYEVLFDSYPDYVEVANNLAFCRMAQGDLRGAHELFSRAVSQNQRLAGSTHVLGMLDAALGRPAESVAHLEEAVRLSPDNESWTLDLEGARAMAGGEDSPASRRFRARLAAYHREAATALQARGRREEARAHLAEAERLQPGDDSAPRLHEDGDGEQVLHGIDHPGGLE